MSLFGGASIMTNYAAHCKNNARVVFRKKQILCKLLNSRIQQEEYSQSRPSSFIYLIKISSMVKNYSKKTVGISS
jgi:hypothetical protein